MPWPILSTTPSPSKSGLFWQMVILCIDNKQWISILPTLSTTPSPSKSGPYWQMVILCIDNKQWISILPTLSTTPSPSKSGPYWQMVTSWNCLQKSRYDIQNSPSSLAWWPIDLFVSSSTHVQFTSLLKWNINKICTYYISLNFPYIKQHSGSIPRDACVACKT